MGFGTPKKLDHAGELAACLAFLALRARERVRVVVAAATRQASRSRAAITSARCCTIVDALDDVEADGTRGLAEGARASRPSAAAPTTAVLLTDLLVEPEVREATLRRLAAVVEAPRAAARARRLRAVARLDDGMLIDSETGEEVPIRGGKAAEEKYKAGLEAWRARVEKRCTELGIIYAPAFTTVPARMLIGGDLRRRGITEAARGGGR